MPCGLIMNVSFSGAGGEKPVGQRAEQLRHQRRLVRIKRLMGQPQLGTAALELQNRDVGHLAAGAAGGGYQHQAALFARLGLFVVEVQDGGDRLEGEQLGKVQNRPSPDADDPPRVPLHIPPDCLRHLVGRLAAAVLFLKNHLSPQLAPAEERTVKELVGEDQVTRADLKRAAELFAAVVAVKRRMQFKLFHTGLLSLPSSNLLSPLYKEAYSVPALIIFAIFFIFCVF